MSNVTAVTWVKEQKAFGAATGRCLQDDGAKAFLDAISVTYDVARSPVERMSYPLFLPPLRE